MIAALPPEALQTALVKRLGLVLSKRSGLALALWGEAGVGKTWLAGRVLEQVPCRHTWLVASASGAQTVLALPKVANLPIWAEQSLEQLRQGSLGAAKAADALGALLSALAPFVLVVEDLHQARPEQQKFWLELAQEILRIRGVGVLFTSRTPPPEPLESFPVGALSREGSTVLLRNLAGNNLPESASGWIYQQAQGNPLFTHEYFRHLSRLGYLWSDGQKWRWREPESKQMPSSIEALVGQIIHSGLNPTAEAALAARAMVPDTLEPGYWAAVTQLDNGQLASAIAELEGQGLLLEGEFVHPLFAEVIRRDIPLWQRQELARRFLDLYQADEPIRAAFFIEEAQILPEEARGLLIRASQDASHERLRAEFLAQAAQHSMGAERQALSAQAAQILRHFDLPSALAAVQQSLGATPNPLVVFLYAELLSELGQGAEAERVLLGIADPEDPRWLEAVLVARMAQGHFSGVVDWWESHPGLGHNPTAKAAFTLGRALVRLGRFEQAKALLEPGFTAHPALDAAWLKSLYASILLDEGDFAAAVGLLDEVIQAFEAIKFADPDFQTAQNRRATARYTRSAANYRWGRYREAISDIEAYLRLLSEQGDGRRFAEGQANLGLYLLEFGEYERAEEVLGESRTVLERTANYRGLSIVGQGLIRLYIEWAPPHGGALALKHAQMAEFYARKSGSPPTLAETLAFVAWAEALYGQSARALGYAEELASLALALNEARLGVFAEWVRGLALEKAGELEQAQGALSEAVAQMRALGHSPFAHRMALELDRIQGNRKAAHTRVAHFEKVGNQNWVNIAHRYFPPTASLVELPESGVRLEVLGTFEIAIDGQPIKYEARKGKELLALLLETRIAGRAEMAGLDLYDILYPEMDEEKAASALKQLVYRLRGVLGSHAITRTSSGYALGAVFSDAEAFLKQGGAALWRGPYLYGLGGGWDATVGESLYHALRVSIEGLIATEPEEALRLARILLEADAFDREALVLALRALEQSQNLGALSRLYEQYRLRFTEVGERLPPDWKSLLKG